jgi:hypothetical protein
MNDKKVVFSLLAIAIVIPLAINSIKNFDTEQENTHEMAHMHHFIGSAEVPESLESKAVKNPRFPVGSKAISKAKHMGEMMYNVEVTIVAAYKTTAYETSFVMPDGTKMKKHRWIVHEEFVNPGNEPKTKGTVLLVLKSAEPSQQPSPNPRIQFPTKFFPSKWIESLRNRKNSIFNQTIDDLHPHLIKHLIKSTENPIVITFSSFFL